MTDEASKKTTNPLPAKDAKGGNAGSDATSSDSKSGDTSTSGDSSSSGSSSGDSSSTGSGRRLADPTTSTGSTKTSSGGTDTSGSTSSGGTDTSGSTSSGGTDTSGSTSSGGTSSGDSKSGDGSTATVDEKPKYTVESTDDYYLPVSPYMVTTKKVAVLDIVNRFFKNENPNACGYKTCKLYHPKCIKPYDGDKLAITGTYPYPLMVALNDAKGYQEKFCIICENEFDYIGKDNVIFS